MPSRPDASPSLDSAYAAAHSARAAGRTTLLLEVEPKRQFMVRYVRLWDGVIAKTRGRKYGRDPLEPETTIVTAIYVEVDIASVFEAFRRAREREAEKLTRPVFGTAGAPPPNTSTRR